MRKFLWEVFWVLFIVVVAKFVFGEKLVDIAKDLLWFYGIFIVIGIALAIWISHALTRAMNPKIKKENENGISKVE